MHLILTFIFTFIAVVIVFMPLFKICYRFKSYGKRNLPKEGGLIVANHASYFDPPLIGCATYPRLLAFLARDTLFGPISGWFLRHVGCKPTKRGKGNVALFKMIPDLVAKGELVVIFPEGTRTKDGEFQLGQPGVALLIQKCNYCPVVPTYVHGTYDIWNCHMRRPKLSGRAAVVFGKPLTFDHLKDKDRKLAQQEMVKEIMDAIIELKNTYVSHSAK
ncbi:MAG: 1-acyl-sn-glycerol-3-phosphate acyltransferase [Chlamydiales bacterium]|nr:1-acyl-sn-glycerol-3-phosphate acyltransferase [Chlamydiales bacterium]MCH9619333.1 1-acyl-sn-glycerol-3-phosphate acyltransferase [Chlamydiales bacterium]MCH9622137.1 1-acyl-sn-glycerol-3-phosphate acyltransferase [Chlamydiales bacterium]